jgi:hypothetical protein
MSLAETLVFGGYAAVHPTVSQSAPVGGTAAGNLGETYNKANYGSYVSVNSTKDEPLLITFEQNTLKSGASDYLIKYQRSRNVLPSSGLPGGRSDAQMSVWLKAVAPIGNTSYGGYTQTDVETAIRSMCVMLLHADNLSRFINGQF